MKNLRYLNKYFYKYRGRLTLGIIFICISNIFVILPAQIIRIAIDVIQENLTVYRAFSGLQLQNSVYAFFSHILLMFGFTILFLAVIRGVFMYIMRQSIIVMSRLIEYDLKNEIYAHFQTLSQEFYRKHSTGDLMSRITEDVSRIRMYLGPAIMFAINLIVIFILVIFTMLYVNAELTLYVLLPLPVLSISIYYVSNIINIKSEAIQRKLAELNSMAQRVFSGIRVIKSYVRETETLQDFRSESENYRKQSLSLVKVESLFFPLMLLMIGLSTILTVYAGGIKVMDGEVTTGNIAEFVIYINMLTWPVTSLGWIASLTQRAEASQGRVNEFLQSRSQMASKKNLKKKISGKIEFKGVRFDYANTGIRALENVNFTINRGDRIAILGRTGSGKSTIANLIARVFDVSEGEVLIDDIPISHYNLKLLRNSIGFVPQESFLFSDTIANNIAFGLSGDGDEIEETDMKKINEAADNSLLSEEIAGFPDGINTKVGERGITLSGGQKQRVSLARAIIKDPAILLLDDSFSAIDSKTEKSIITKLGKLPTGQTMVIITHRISSIKNINRIIVLEAGEIVEEGTHHNLMAKKGLYYALYQKQKLEDTGI